MLLVDVVCWHILCCKILTAICLVNIYVVTVVLPFQNANDTLDTLPSLDVQQLSESDENAAEDEPARVCQAIEQQWRSREDKGRTRRTKRIGNTNLPTVIDVDAQDSRDTSDCFSYDEEEETGPKAEKKRTIRKIIAGQWKSEQEKKGRTSPHPEEMYTPANMRQWMDSAAVSLL